MTQENYQFVRFTGTGSKTGQYAISLNSSYSFGLLSDFYSKENIRSFKKAVMFYDSANKAVAISFTNDENAEGAFAVTHGVNNGSISCRSFFLKNNLKQEEFLGQRVPKKIKDDRLGALYVIDLIKH